MVPYAISGVKFLDESMLGVSIMTNMSHLPCSAKCCCMDRFLLVKQRRAKDKKTFFLVPETKSAQDFPKPGAR